MSKPLPIEVRKVPIKNVSDSSGLRSSLIRASSKLIESSQLSVKLKVMAE